MPKPRPGLRPEDYELTRVVETFCCHPALVTTTDEQGQVVFGVELYGLDATQGAPEAAVTVSSGCGVVLTAVADLRPGEVVFDLG